MKNQLLTENFKIRNRIDMGTDGLFDPGSESRLLQKLKDSKNGEKTLHYLITRGAIELIQEKPEAKKNPHPKKAKKASGGGSGQEPEVKTADATEDGSKEPQDETSQEGTDQETEKTPEKEEPAQGSEEQATDEADESEGTDEESREATGEWRISHYGGGRHEIINPEGQVVDTGVRGEEKALKRMEELKSKE